MRVSQNIACLQGRMIWGWLWLGPGWDNFRRLHSNYELNLFPASSTQDDTRMPSTFWGHCSQDDGRMIFEKFCFQKKSVRKNAIILFSRMMSTQTRMNHPKIAYHPGFIERPARNPSWIQEPIVNPGTHCESRHPSWIQKFNYKSFLGEPEYPLSDKVFDRHGL